MVKKTRPSREAELTARAARYVASAIATVEREDRFYLDFVQNCAMVAVQVVDDQKAIREVVAHALVPFALGTI